MKTMKSFHVKKMLHVLHYGKSLLAIFREFFASINKTFILAERMGTRLSSHGA